jgi:hypothetical protein
MPIVPDMVDEVLFPVEGLGAESAGVRHVARVLPDVVVEVFLARERARAVRALVWSFTRMLSAQQSTFRFVDIHYIPRRYTTHKYETCNVL